ncbi:MAG: response regulator transcription factor [Candidatus Promineifilaceae bacterium]
MNNGKRLLIVEDNLELAEMLSDYFHAQGYRVTAVDQGEEGLRRAEAEQPDIVLLDVHLPDIDGYQVCRRLRQSRRTGRLPVIFLTERRRREDRLAGLELGAVDYITKPFDIQELSLRVRNAVRHGRGQAANPVTGLPEGPAVRERLSQTLARPEWALVVAGLRGLDAFRDEYGFVAADDATRAVGLMITNALEASGAAADFVGHLGPAYFVVVTDPERLDKVAAHCRQRLEAAIPYFYSAYSAPARPRQRLAAEVFKLSSAEGGVTSLEELRAAVNATA